MNRDTLTSTSIIISEGRWGHIRCVQIRHPLCPEVRGEGASLAEAARHLATQLTRALDFTPGRAGREPIEAALSDVRAALPVRRPRSRGPAEGLSTRREKETQPCPRS
jgi:hypothetical protein